MATNDWKSPAPGYSVRKVNIQDPRYGSPNYRHVAVSPSGRQVGERKHLTRESAVASTHAHASDALGRQFESKRTEH